MPWPITLAVVLSKCLRTLRAILSGFRLTLLLEVVALLVVVVVLGLALVGCFLPVCFVGLVAGCREAAGMLALALAVAVRTWRTGRATLVVGRVGGVVVAVVVGRTTLGWRALAAASWAARLASCSFIAATARMCPGRKSKTCGCLTVLVALAP